MLAVNFDIFLAPFDIAPGGTSGMAIIIHEFTGWLKGLTMFILTIPMLILGFYQLGRFRFLLRASYVTLIYSFGVDLLATWLPVGVTDDLLLNALYGGIVGGIGIGLIYRGGTSPAGTSVISRVLNLNIGKYDVEADVGASYGSRRQETVEALTLVLTQAPAPSHSCLTGDPYTVRRTTSMLRVSS